MRPKKIRRIEKIPEHRYFKPQGVPKNMLNEVELKIEEIEALRLKDVEGLQQTQCADKMNVSRQTFQLIVAEARKKIVTALTTGMAIRISGGIYSYNICKYVCEECDTLFEKAYEEDSIECPKCGSHDYKCCQKNGFCEKKCEK